MSTSHSLSSLMGPILSYAYKQEFLHDTLILPLEPCENSKNWGSCGPESLFQVSVYLNVDQLKRKLLFTYPADVIGKSQSLTPPGDLYWHEQYFWRLPFHCTTSHRILFCLPHTPYYHPLLYYLQAKFHWLLSNSILIHLNWFMSKKADIPNTACTT